MQSFFKQAKTEIQLLNFLKHEVLRDGRNADGTDSTIGQRPLPPQPRERPQP